MPEGRMRRLPVAAAVAFLGASALYVVQATRLPLGSLEQPGPGLFPVAVGTLLLAAGGAFLWQALGPAREGVGAPDARGTARVIGVAGTLVAFCLALPWLGYGGAAFGLLVALLHLFGLARWSVVAAVALLTTAASYYLFAFLLGVPLPGGFLAP